MTYYYLFIILVLFSCENEKNNGINKDIIEKSLVDSVLLVQTFEYLKNAIPLNDSIRLNYPLKNFRKKTGEQYTFILYNYDCCDFLKVDTSRSVILAALNKKIPFEDHIFYIYLLELKNSQFQNKIIGGIEYYFDTSVYITSRLIKENQIEIVYKRFSDDENRLIEKSIDYYKLN